MYEFNIHSSPSTLLGAAPSSSSRLPAHPPATAPPCRAPRHVLKLHKFPVVQRLTTQQRGLLIPKSSCNELASLLGMDTLDIAQDMLRRRPELANLTPELLAQRLVELKSILPGSNLPELLALAPSLLLLDDLDATVGHAIRQLHALMPGIPIESRLHLGGTVYWSFLDLVTATSLNKTAAEILLTRPVRVHRSSRAWPGLLGQDARVVKAFLESNTGHQVQLVSADSVPNIMFNTVPGVLRKSLQQRSGASSNIVVIYNPRNGKVAISPRLV